MSPLFASLITLTSLVIPGLYLSLDGSSTLVPVLMVFVSGVFLATWFYYGHVSQHSISSTMRMALICQIAVWLLVFMVPKPTENISMALNSPQALRAEQFSTMSIILPCANEDEFAEKTIKSILMHSDMNLIEEIIMIDDGSKTHLETLFSPEIIKEAKLRFIRHEQHKGLTPSRQEGADVASGDILFFMDCHCAVSPNWLEPLFEGIRENPKRFVVPSTSWIDLENWSVSAGDNGMSGGSRLMWQPYLFDLFGFKEDPAIMILTGCVIGVSKKWWKELGGYDTSMSGWGGENIETSLRNWLCGGEILRVKESRVAHAFGSQKDKAGGRASYTVEAGSKQMNCYRAVVVWSDEFIDKFIEFNSGPLQSGNEISLSPMKEIKERLQCKHFSYFLDRFYKFYHWGGMLPKTVYSIRDETSGLCVDTSKPAIYLSDCSSRSPSQIWHGANQDGEKCCSGIAQWNQWSCIDATHSGVQLHGCEFDGTNSNQIVSLDSGQLKLKKADECLVPAETGELSDEDEEPSLLVRTRYCDAEGPSVASHMRLFRRGGDEEQKTFQISNDSGNSCLSVDDNKRIVLIKQGDADNDCDASWYMEGPTLRHLKFDGLCLDAANGTPMMYICYPVDSNNGNQQWTLGEKGDRVASVELGQCLSYSNKPPPRIPLVIGKCQDSKVRFAKYNEAVPLEYQIYQRAGLDMDWGFPKE